MLTEIQIRNAKPREKRYLLHDEHGLYLQITPAGGRSWKFRYWTDGKEKKLTLGDYPLISLKDARAKRDRLRVQILDGVPPSIKVSAEIKTNTPTFSEVFDEWAEKKVWPTLSHEYAKDVVARAKNHILPFIGDRFVRDLRSQDVLELIRRL